MAPHAREIIKEAKKKKKKKKKQRYQEIKE
jgi:hypothetical protein